MIRCPNCGSTAQVKVLGHSNVYSNTPKMNFKCGCGCHFEATYQKKEIKILKNNT